MFFPAICQPNRFYDRFAWNNNKENKQKQKNILGSPLHAHLTSHGLNWSVVVPNTGENWKWMRFSAHLIMTSGNVLIWTVTKCNLQSAINNCNKVQDSSRFQVSLDIFYVSSHWIRIWRQGSSSNGSNFALITSNVPMHSTPNRLQSIHLLQAFDRTLRSKSFEWSFTCALRF